ncbi:putative adhesin [Kitasatospora sp. NPDC048540]|uniref:putative adhesin n=1 Tax=Kitasatospora sp. NPDC048540 TaxID=3155634 RepID=UPI0033EE93A9
MTIWVASHGTFDANAQPLITLPDGWTLSTYTDHGTVLEKVVGYEVARRGLPPDPDHVHRGPVEISNYNIGALTLVEALDYLTVKSPQIRLKLAGYDFDAPPGTALCQGTAESCTASGHTCTGILGSAGPLASTGDRDIHLIACLEPTVDGKRLAHAALIVTETLPGENNAEWFTALTQSQDKWLANMIASVQDMGARREIMADFERLNEEDKVLLLQRDAIRKFCYGHYGAEFLLSTKEGGEKQHGKMSFHRWLMSLDESERDLYIASDNPVPDGRDAYWEIYRWFAEFAANPELAWSSLEEIDRASLREGNYDLVRDEQMRDLLKSFQLTAAKLDIKAVYTPPAPTIQGIYFDENATTIPEDTPQPRYYYTPDSDENSTPDDSQDDSQYDD